jgi:hypothetical protein
VVVYKLLASLVVHILILYLTLRPLRIVILINLNHFLVNCKVLERNSTAGVGIQRMENKSEIASHREVGTIQQEKHIGSGDVDEALKFLRDGGDSSSTEINERSLVRRIDWMMMPLMFACYFLQYMDKTLSMAGSKFDEFKRLLR